MQWLIRRAFNTPHSSKQIEDAIGWALETNAETLIASTVGDLAARATRRGQTALARRARCPVLVISAPNDRITAHADAGARHGLGERPVLAGSGQLALELGLRHLPPAAIDVVARRLDDAIQHIHAGVSSPVRATNRSSAAAAAPSSIVASAARTPASSVSARPHA